MYEGDFTTSNTMYVYFNTFDSNDPSASVIVSAFVVGDIAIYKNGSTTQRTSTAGFTLLDTDGIDFDGVTGVHGFSIDLSDNTDAGFYAAGAEYAIIVGPVTVDAATINFIAATFSIERTGGALALLKGTNSLANIEDKIDIIDTNVDDIETAVGTAGAGLTDLGGMSTGMKAEVEVEVNDALDTSISELGVAQPTSTPTLRTGLMLLYMALRNKVLTQTSATDALEFHNDAGTKITSKLLTDDAADYTEAKMT